ncbi:MAG: hypothetical protein ACR2P2_19120 [Nakamurella sp.]
MATGLVVLGAVVELVGVAGCETDPDGPVGVLADGTVLGAGVTVFGGAAGGEVHPASTAVASSTDSAALCQRRRRGRRPPPLLACCINAWLPESGR